jgi:hypothetical protein
MGGNKMRKATYAAAALALAALFLFASVAAIAAPATVKRSVQKLEDGNYIIKLVVTAEKDDIYAFELKDPKSTIIDVYAPKSWCMLTDGEVCHSRTGAAPIGSKKGFEFIIHATSPDAQYVWTFYDRVKQIGKSEVL